jgi:broad specificity phosphatase PhoE
VDAPRTILTLVRHGETAANQAGVWHGSIDTPLSERGHRQASRVAEYLGERHTNVRALYASPLARARHTAEAIARRLSIDLRIEEELSEYHLGSWEGLSYEVLHNEMHLWDEIRENPHFAPHGGESPLQVSERFAGVLRRIAAQHAGERVVVVTHGGAMSLGLARLLDGHYSRWRGVMDNCGVSELAFEPTLELLTFNHTAHLDGV